MKNITTSNSKLQPHILNNHFECHPDKRITLLLTLLLSLQTAYQRSITKLGMNEPRIWQTIDRLGNIWWHAYNPATGRSATRESEREILEWLDRRIVDGY